jgi:hypothetical protein
VLNAGTGDVKRHAGGYVWEIQVGGSASDRIGFYGVTPVVQPSGADQAAVTLGNVDGEIAGLTISDPPTQAEVQALRDKTEELADDLRNFSTLIHSLRTALVGEGWQSGEVATDPADHVIATDTADNETLKVSRHGKICFLEPLGNPCR